MSAAQQMHELRAQLTRLMDDNGFSISSFYYSHDGEEDTLSVLCYRKPAHGTDDPGPQDQDNPFAELVEN